MSNITKKTTKKTATKPLVNLTAFQQKFVVDALHQLSEHFNSRETETILEELKASHTDEYTGTWDNENGLTGFLNVVKLITNVTDKTILSMLINAIDADLVPNPYYKADVA